MLSCPNYNAVQAIGLVGVKYLCWELNSNSKIVQIFFSQCFVLECFSAAVIDPKGPKHFSHFVPSPFSEGLPTRRHREGLAPNRFLSILSVLINLIMTSLILPDRTRHFNSSDSFHSLSAPLLCPVHVLITLFSVLTPSWVRCSIHFFQMTPRNGGYIKKSARSVLQYW
jgi:hypothetical protein